MNKWENKMAVVVENLNKGQESEGADVLAPNGWGAAERHSRESAICHFILEQVQRDPVETSDRGDMDASVGQPEGTVRDDLSYWWEEMLLWSARI